MEKIWHWSSVELSHIPEVEKDDGYLKHALNWCVHYQALFMVNIEYRNPFAISNNRNVEVANAHQEVFIIYYCSGFIFHHSRLTELGRSKCSD